MHDARADRLRAEAAADRGLTVDHFVSRLALHLDRNALFLNEGITNYGVIFDHLARTKPGSILTSGGGSLGWNGGAAIGAKLASPDKDVVAICGDGSYLFSIPSSVHWMAQRYGTPFLQIVLNNGGWNAPRHSALAVHPSGYASRANELDLSFDPAPDYGAIAAAAGGAYARSVDRVEDVDRAIADAIHVLHNERRCAVLDVKVSQA
jgi:acetolactate synthase-1/2/3 large subunit